MGDAAEQPMPALREVGSGLVPVAAGAGAVAVVASSTGSLVVAALLVAVAAGRRATGVALALAVGSVGVRFATVGLDDLAGLQSVLGPAGAIEPATGAAASWLAAAAVVAAVVAVPPPVDRAADLVDRVRPWVLAAAGGAMAAAIVAGPGPDDLLVRAGATVGGVALAAALVVPSRRTRVAQVRLGLSVVAGVAAVVLAAVPS